MPDEIKNIFISHIHEDDQGLRDLKGLLSRNDLEARDYSINADKPNQAKSEDYIKSKILAPQIDACSVLVVYISPETKDSKYVAWEIEYAANHDKRIVGVWEYGQGGCEVPKALGDIADAIVGWNGGRIVDAITGKYDGCETPEGQQVDRLNIKRHPC